ncbi:MAG: glycosyltransferase family 4 protein [Gammaproteobacteria bacterium]
MNGSLPRLMFLTSPDAGLAHYVVHLWRPISTYFNPLFVTYRSSPPDDLVQSQIEAIYPLIDPEDPASIDAIVEFARSHGVEYVDLHSGSRTKLYPSYFSSLLFRLREGGIRVVVHLHNASIYSVGPCDSAVVSAVVRNADAVLVGSMREAATVQSVLGSGFGSVGLMYHGPYTLFDEGRFDRADARRDLGLSNETPMVLSFGALRNEKRLEDLLDAFHLIRCRIPEAKLLVQSTAQYSKKRDWFETLATQPGIQPRIGYAPARTVEALFKAADVVALPYEDVAASGVLNLARGFARPVVVSEKFEQATIIDGICGYSVPVKNPAALAEALSRILEMPQAKRENFAHGWTGILNEENWSNAALAVWNACRLKR